MQAFLDRLEKAKFSGNLSLNFDRGCIVSAELKHWLAKAEFAETVTTVEKEQPQCPITD